MSGLRRPIEALAGGPPAFRSALLAVPPAERDAWVDGVLGLEGVWEDGPTLPRGCVPYLPCAVDAVVAAIDLARVNEHDVFVDIGAGIGRAAMLAHLITGAASIAVEVQPHLAEAARALGRRIEAPRFSVVQGDAAAVGPELAMGSVFFLYCPFSGDRIEQMLARLEGIAASRTIRVCCVHLPLPPRPWLERVASPNEGAHGTDVVVYRSTV